MESIAFIRSDKGNPPEIVIKSLSDGAERSIVRFHSPAYPPSLRWSSDVRWLILAERPADDKPAAIFRVSAESGEKVRITEPPAGSLGDGCITISPDGRRIAFVRAQQPTIRDVYVVDLTPDMLPAGKPRRVTSVNVLIDALTSVGEPWVRNDLDQFRRCTRLELAGLHGG
jgi:hypothetical protein